MILYVDAYPPNNMFGIRTPIKQAEKNPEHQQSPSRVEPRIPNVRRSIGEWEASKTDATPASTQPVKAALPGPSRITQKQPLSLDSKTSSRRASVETLNSPAEQVKYISRVSEARACLAKAKLHLNNSKNLKTEIKTEVTQAVERLYNLVKELEEERKGKGGKDVGKKGQKQEGTTGKNDNDMVIRMEEQTKLLLQNSKKLDDLKAAIEEQRGSLQKMTYAEVAAAKQRENPLN